jgi:hypothetical protein
VVYSRVYHTVAHARLMENVSSFACYYKFSARGNYKLGQSKIWTRSAGFWHIKGGVVGSRAAAVDMPRITVQVPH